MSSTQRWSSTWVNVDMSSGKLRFGNKTPNILRRLLQCKKYFTIMKQINNKHLHRQALSLLLQSVPTRLLPKTYTTFCWEIHHICKNQIQHYFSHFSCNQMIPTTIPKTVLVCAGSTNAKTKLISFFPT